MLRSVVKAAMLKPLLGLVGLLMLHSCTAVTVEDFNAWKKFAEQVASSQAGNAATAAMGEAIPEVIRTLDEKVSEQVLGEEEKWKIFIRAFSDVDAILFVTTNYDGDGTIQAARERAIVAKANELRELSTKLGDCFADHEQDREGCINKVIDVKDFDADYVKNKLEAERKRIGLINPENTENTQGNWEVYARYTGIGALYVKEGREERKLLMDIANFENLKEAKAVKCFLKQITGAALFAQVQGPAIWYSIINELRHNPHGFGGDPNANEILKKVGEFYDDSERKTKKFYCLENDFDLDKTGEALYEAYVGYFQVLQEALGWPAFLKEDLVAAAAENRGMNESPGWLAELKNIDEFDFGRLALALAQYASENHVREMTNELKSAKSENTYDAIVTLVEMIQQYPIHIESQKVQNLIEDGKSLFKSRLESELPSASMSSGQGLAAKRLGRKKHSASRKGTKKASKRRHQSKAAVKGKKKRKQKKMARRSRKVELPKKRKHSAKRQKQTAKKRKMRPRI